MAVAVEFCLLGSLEVRRDGVVLPLAGAKLRTVLATLLLEANRVVPTAGLAEAVWGSSQPRSAQVSVRNYVKRLRHTLGDLGRDRIKTRARGYAIEIGADELDVTRFEALLWSAHAAARSGCWDAAAGQAHTALALWRGEPLADVDSELLAVRNVPYLAEMRLQALEVHIEARLRQGHHAEVVGEVRQLAAGNPMRERLHALLMLALYRDGRQGEALAAYQRARDLLIDELGTEPGTELRRLHQRILIGDPALASTAGRPALAADVPPAAAAGSEIAVPRQLPAPVRHFAGRAAELAILNGLLGQAGPGVPGSVVIVGGTAGVGKTALAVHWAHQVVAHFPDGQLYANLRGFEGTATPVTAGDALRAFLDALGVPADRIPPTPGAQEGLYRSMLADKRMLVLLDNAADTAQLRPLLPGSPHCLVVVTSRCQLTGLVAAAGAQPVLLDVLDEDEARKLLADRLGPERAAAEAGPLTDLIELCARLPLALTIAAARAVLRPGLPASALVTELRAAGRRLDAFEAEDASSSVRAVFSWSYRRLSRGAARMFRLLGVHPGPDISADAAASMAGLPLPAARRDLDELTSAHLLAEHREGRFSFHDLLRAYAAERAAGEECEAGLRSAIGQLLGYYLHTAHAADRLLAPARDPLVLDAPRAQPDTQPYTQPERAGLEDYARALEWFRAERHALVGAVTLAERAGFDAHAWQIPWTMVTFFDLEGHWQDAVRVQETALAAAERLGDRSARARIHRSLSAALVPLDSLPAAEAHLRHSLALCIELGDQVGQARVNLDLARIAERQGSLRDALHRARLALGLLEAAGSKSGQGRALNIVGWYSARLGDYRQALIHCPRAVRVCGELGDLLGVAAAWDSLGYAHTHLGDQSRAVACYQHAIDLTGQLGDRYHLADALTHLGDAHWAAGRSWQARLAWGRALAILDELSHPDAEQLRAKLDVLA